MAPCILHFQIERMRNEAPYNLRPPHCRGNHKTKETFAIPCLNCFSTFSLKVVLSPNSPDSPPPSLCQARSYYAQEFVRSFFC